MRIPKRPRLRVILVNDTQNLRTPLSRIFLVGVKLFDKRDLNRNYENLVEAEWKQEMGPYVPLRNETWYQ